VFNILRLRMTLADLTALFFLPLKASTSLHVRGAVFLEWAVTQVNGGITPSVLLAGGNLK